MITFHKTYAEAMEKISQTEIMFEARDIVHAIIALDGAVILHSGLAPDPGPIELYDLIGDDGHYLARDAQGNDLAVPREQYQFIQLVNRALATPGEPADVDG